MKKFVGIGLLATLLVAPFAMMPRTAEAADVGDICYFGKVGHRLGIYLVVDPELADLAVRARVATRDYEFIKRSYRGYEICVRSNEI